MLILVMYHAGFFFNTAMDTIASLTEQEEERELFQSMVTVEKRSV